MDTNTATAPALPDYSPLTLVKMRNDDKRGTFRYEGHEITVVVNASDHGRYNAVRACSPTHPGLTRVLSSRGLLIKRAVGKYEMRFNATASSAEHGYEDRGTVASLAERVVRFTV